MSNNDSLKKKKIDKGYIIGFLICLLVCTFITSLVILQEVDGQNRDFSKEYLIILTDSSIPSTVICSNGPWNAYPPAPRLGHGRPMKLSLAPSVPPRTGREIGSKPTERIASRASSTTYSFFSITSSMFL